MKKLYPLIPLVFLVASQAASAGFIDVRPAPGKAAPAAPAAPVPEGVTTVRAATPAQVAEPQPEQKAAPAAASAAPAPTKEDVSPVAPTGARRFSPTVAEVGRRPALFIQPKGMGRDIEIADSLKFVVPENYAVYADPKADLKRRASWVGGRNWPDILTDLLRDAGLSATVAWDARTVTIHAANSISESGMPVHNDKVLDEFLGKEMDKLPATKKNLPRWEIALADVSIRRVMSRWAKEAGWQIAWEASKDFPVSVEASVEATFDDAIGMVVESVSKSEYPIKALFCEGNKTVLVVRYGDNTEGVCK